MSEDTKEANTAIDAAYEILKSKLPKVPGAKPEQRRAYLQDLRTFYEDSQGTWIDMITAMGKGSEAYALLSDCGDAFNGSQQFMPQEVHIYLNHWEFCYGPLDSTEKRFITVTNTVTFYADDYPDLSSAEFIDQMFLIFQLGLSGQITQTDTDDKGGIACGAAVFFEAGPRDIRQLDAQWLSDDKQQVGVKTKQYRNHSIPHIALPPQSPLLKINKHGTPYYPTKDPAAILTPKTAKKLPRFHTMTNRQLITLLTVLQFVAMGVFYTSLIARSSLEHNYWALGIFGTIAFGLIAVIVWLFPRVIAALVAVWGVLIGGTIITTGSIFFAYGEWRNHMDNNELNVFDWLVILAALALGIYVGIKLMNRTEKWADRFVRK